MKATTKRALTALAARAATNPRATPRSPARGADAGLAGAVADARPISVPIKAGYGMNAREHWQQRAKRVRGERHAVAWLLRNRSRPPIPCSVLLIRVAPSAGLDDDNLAGSLKSVRDEVADWLGVNDRDSLTVHYRYAQLRGPWAVRIEFGPPVPGAQMRMVEFFEGCLESAWPRS